MIRRAEQREDFALCAEINNAVHPERAVTVDQLTESKGTFLLHGADGYAYVDRSSIPDCAFTMIRVLSASRCRGVGSALLAGARRHASGLGFVGMWGRVAEDDEDSLRFVTRRGFEETTRDIEVLLEIAPGDGEIAPGIVEAGKEHRRGVYAVAAECIPEMALPQVAEVDPFDEWLEREEQHSAVAFVSLDRGEVVGYARLYELSAFPHRLANGLTAVRRSHRRRGIATALKRAQIAWAAERGYREIQTAMVAGNEAMRAVNERLGYRPLPGWIVVQGPLPP
jgi:mycothiol synthase